MRLPNVRLLGLLVQLSYKNFKRSKKEKIFFSVLALLWLIIFTFLSSFNSVLFIVNANNVLHPNTHSDFDVSLTVNFPSLTSLFNLIHVIVSQPY